MTLKSYIRSFVGKCLLSPLQETPVSFGTDEACTHGPAKKKTTQQRQFTNNDGSLTMASFCEWMQHFPSK